MEKTNVNFVPFKKLCFKMGEYFIEFEFLDISKANIQHL